MARPRTLYVRERDIRCWNLATEQAWRERTSLSDLTARALCEYLRARGVPTDNEEARVTAKAVR